jgi:two-component system sensor histidine kinase QseC
MLRPLLDELLRAHSETAASRGISLRLRCMIDHLCVDADMLRIVLRNLVDNALRYCAPGCVVEVSASHAYSHVNLPIVHVLPAKITVCPSLTNITRVNKSRRARFYDH